MINKLKKLTTVKKLCNATHPDGESDLSSVHVPCDVLMDEARWFRQIQEMKKAKLDEKFHRQICFPDDDGPKIKLSQNQHLCGIDRVEVTSQMKE